MTQQSTDLVINLMMHFLHYLSDTSNNMCNAEGKKTITPPHVIKALKVSPSSTNLQQLKMHGYLAKILEIDSGAKDLGSSNEEESVGGGSTGKAKKAEDQLLSLTDKEAKKMIEQKL